MILSGKHWLEVYYIIEEMENNDDKLVGKKEITCQFWGNCAGHYLRTNLI